VTGKKDDWRRCGSDKIQTTYEAKKIEQKHTRARIRICLREQIYVHIYINIH